MKTAFYNETIAQRLSFRSVFPLTFFLLVFAVAVKQSAFIDPDLWWHLQTGQNIVLSKTIPHTDIYSFTKAGSEWITHEWLSEVLIYGIYRISGWGGLLFIFSGLITAALYIVYYRSEGKPYIAAAVTLLAAASSAPLFGIRPQMITLLLASIYIAALSGYVRDSQRQSLWWLVPLMFLWVNLHAGYALGLALIGLYLISVILDKKWHLIRPLAVLFLACAVVVPLNPNGFRMFSYPFETLMSPTMAAFIDEWQSPDFHKLMFLPLALFLLLLLTTMALSPRRARAGELFLLFVTGFGALRSVRHIPIFALIAAPILARDLLALLQERGWEMRLMGRETPGGRFALVFTLLLFIAPAAVAVLKVQHFTAHQVEYEAKNYPRAAVNFLSEKRLPGPIYNRYGWGGYLIRRLHPEYQVYIDGRADVYGDALMLEAMRSYDGHTQWREPLERHSIKTVLISPQAPLASLLRNDRAWEKAYEDAQAVIFTRSVKNPDLTASVEPERKIQSAP